MFQQALLQAVARTRREPEAELARKFIESVEALNRSLAIPRYLEALCEEDIAKLAQAACREADDEFNWTTREFFSRKGRCLRRAGQKAKQHDHKTKDAHHASHCETAKC